jgi:hypothetical protein
LIEPYFGPFASFVYSHVHKQEYFNKSVLEWESARDSRQVMSEANQALAYVVFVRDRRKFELENPTLELVRAATVSNYLRYLLSGGVNFKQLITNGASRVIRWGEWLLSPVQNLLALHFAIIIRKR